MKDQLIGCAFMLLLAALGFAWWLPKTHTAFWLILIGGFALWFGAIYLKVIFTIAIPRSARPNLVPVLM